MEPWYKVATPRAEVREGRSFNPDEFAIALEQVVAGTAPEDYRNPKKFFDRTVFTRAVTDHLGLVLRRLAGETQNTAPVLSLITQFGGGKTHTLAALYHLVHNAKASATHPEIQALLAKVGQSSLPTARAAVFVGNAWDPGEGKETPWIDVARQLAGPAGVEALGPKARSTPPGTEAINRLVQAAGGRVLFLFDEVLNFFNRHRDLSEHFYAFVQNLTVAMTGTSGSAALISLPRSLVEMTDFDQRWLDRISKVVNRVARDLIANDESEISEVVRRRLFDDLGGERIRKSVAKEYAEWCFERRHQLPPEWTAVDAVTTDAKAKDLLRSRFEVAYPFHPATISVFQRKWQGLAHYQRTRGTLAMFAQWISMAGTRAFQGARREPLITLGSAPLDKSEFQATILGQLGEQRLLPAIEVDIAGTASHARALDADSKGKGKGLQELHRRVGAAILFESTGVASDKAAHLPELRFALGEPGLDITSIDNAATALEKRSFFIRRVGTDGYRIGYKPTLKKIVGDRRAGLDDAEVAKAIRNAVKQVTDKGRVLTVVPLVTDGSDVADNPKLTIVVLDPEIEWEPDGEIRRKVAEWTRQRGGSNRFYPAALVWLARKPGRTLREKAELFLAWKRVAEDLSSGTLGTDFDASERGEIASQIKDSEEALHDEVWASYRYALVADAQGLHGIREIDLGAGHSSSVASFSARVVAALKAEGLLNESVGAGYLDRSWPPALKDSGAWPLKGLRQAFLDGTLTRLPDPEDVLRRQIVSFVERGEFGLGSGPKDASYQHVWWKEPVAPEEVTFDDKTFLLTRERAALLKEKPASAVDTPLPDQGGLVLEPPPSPTPTPAGQSVRLSLRGAIPPEQWNKLGTKLLPKLRTAGKDLSLGIDATFTVRAEDLRQVEADLRQALRDLGLEGVVRIESGG
ncbi:MAG: DUF499 domain-containing protein [Acidobacteria bacterium]|nr:DUF499 domain-containing protein [Acidobacteriota bacterium]